VDMAGGGGGGGGVTLVVVVAPFLRNPVGTTRVAATAEPRLAVVIASASEAVVVAIGSGTEAAAAAAAAAKPNAAPFLPLAASRPSARRRESPTSISCSMLLDLDLSLAWLVVVVLTVFFLGGCTDAGAAGAFRLLLVNKAPSTPARASTDSSIGDLDGPAASAVPSIADLRGRFPAMVAMEYLDDAIMLGFEFAASSDSE